MPHIHEKIDFTATVYIVHNNRVLLRKHDKYKLWLAVGGHIELDEDPPHAAVREAKEEVGLDVVLASATPIQQFIDAKALLPPQFMNRMHINDTHEHIDLIYFGTSESGSIKQGDTEISDDVRWFTSAELDDPSFGINDRIRYYAHAALQALS